MKQIPLILILAWCSMAGWGQSLSPQVLASSGGFGTSPDFTFSYTVGEMTMVQTFSNGSIVLTQGFQQSDDNPTAVHDLPANLGSFSIYPNPVMDNLSYDFQFTGNGKINTCIYNSLGQRTGDIYTADYNGGMQTQRVNISAYAAGIYFLTMYFTSATNNQTYIISKKFQVIN